MTQPAPPRAIAGIAVPDDEVAVAAWQWAQRALPAYLFTHSVRAYFWGAALGARDGLAVESRILWPAALFHDAGLTRLARARQCFEYEGAEIARRFVRKHGMTAPDAGRVARAIVLHMAPSVTLADGVESVLLARATGLDVRGLDAHLVAAVAPQVLGAFPRGEFDRRFRAAISREVSIRTDCASAGLLGRLPASLEEA